MRPLQCALAVWLLAAPGSTAADVAESDGFVIAGQSNALGASTQYENEKQARVTSPSASGLASWSFRLADHAWVLANEFPCDDTQCAGTACAFPGPHRTVAGHPQRVDEGTGTCVCRCGVHVPSNNAGDADATRGSPWPTFAAQWMHEHGRSVRFVASAIGAQTLVAPIDAAQPAWSPTAMDCATLAPVGTGEPPPSLAQPGELFCRMLESVALADLHPLRAVLWMQGESDAPTVGAAEYRAALERLADEIWARLGVPLVVAPISAKTRTDDACTASDGELALRQVMIEVAQSHPHVRRGPSADDLALEADCTHIHDVATLGERWYEAVRVAVPEPGDLLSGAVALAALAGRRRYATSGGGGASGAWAGGAAPRLRTSKS